MTAESDDAIPLSAKSCAQCGAGMDAGETVCPQCGHGLKDYAERKQRAVIERREKTPKISLPDLPSPAARRRYLRAKISNKAIAPTWFPQWLARFLLLEHIHPAPPVARQVAARALVLAAVAARGDLERQQNQTACHQPLAWLKGVGAASALEGPERAFLNSAAGRVEEKVVTAASWRREGLAVLAWALEQFELPAYDSPVVPPDAAHLSVGFQDPQIARELLARGELRPRAEVDQLAAQLTVVSWRLQQFAIMPGPMDLVAHLGKVSSSSDIWLKGLRIMDGDLAIGAQPLDQASAEAVQLCRSIAIERQIAAYWLQGDDPAYSAVQPVTLFSVLTSRST
jgi:Domain of unknown function (DUF4272)